MQKVYKKLTKAQKVKKVIFSSTLSKGRTERPEDKIHEVKEGDHESDRTIRLLRLDKFFINSPWNYNIIRT